MEGLLHTHTRIGDCLVQNRLYRDGQTERGWGHTLRAGGGGGGGPHKAQERVEGAPKNKKEWCLERECAQARAHDDLCAWARAYVYIEDRPSPILFVVRRVTGPLGNRPNFFVVMAFFS